jgi:hypothetical protein
MDCKDPETGLLQGRATAWVIPFLRPTTFSSFGQSDLLTSIGHKSHPGERLRTTKSAASEHFISVCAKTGFLPKMELRL